MIDLSALRSATGISGVSLQNDAGNILSLATNHTRRSIADNNIRADRILGVGIPSLKDLLGELVVGNAFVLFLGGNKTLGVKNVISKTSIVSSDGVVGRDNVSILLHLIRVKVGLLPSVGRGTSLIGPAGFNLRNNLQLFW